MDGLFQIGDFCFRLICGDGITPTENFLRFAVEAGTPEYTYTLEACDSIELPAEEPAVVRPDMLLYRNGLLETRYIGVKGRPDYYARYCEESENSARIAVAPHKTRMELDPVFASLLALERRMIDRGGLILHCAYLEHRGQAILFSAPSGTGKSTQAGLWERYRGSRTINGDRCLLQRIDGVWHARGWPVCGSSEICENRDTPVRAIVMLSQAKTDTVTPLRPMRSFSQLYSQVTVNVWNRAAQQQAMDLLEQLVGDVPVFHLGCTVSENAVRVLETVVKI